MNIQSDPFDLLLAQVRTAMSDEPTSAPTTRAECATHSVASRCASLIGELDSLIAMSLDYDSPDLQRAIQSEELALSAVLTRAQLLCSFVEASKPRGLRVVTRR